VAAWVAAWEAWVVDSGKHEVAGFNAPHCVRCS
jgi:hypothetical protein